MSLPKKLLTSPEFTTKLPSSGKQIKYRPFLVKEEKILLMAMEGEDNNEIITAIQSVLSACIINDDVDVHKLPSFDLEFLFLKLRSKSVGEIITRKLGHQDEADPCQHKTEIKIDIDSIEVKKPEGHDTVIMLDDKTGVKMRYPSLYLMKELEETQSKGNELDSLFTLVAKSIEVVFQGEVVYDQFDLDEAKSFVEDMNDQQFKKVMDFFHTMPKLSHTFDWTCPECKKKEQVTLEGIRNFFT